MMMVDLKQECLEKNMLNNSSKSQGSSESMKACTGCHTTTTPLWRGGPAGPKTLCNACGIKYHKKRRALLGLECGKTEKPKTKKKMRSTSSSACKSYSNGSDEDEEKPSFRKIKMGLNKFSAGGGKLGEEEQAAMLLMALSCGSVYA